MIVEITKCSDKEYWYYHSVGVQFNVNFCSGPLEDNYDLTEEEFLRIKHMFPVYVTGLSIDVQDCKVIKHDSIMPNIEEILTHCDVATGKFTDQEHDDLIAAFRRYGMLVRDITLDWAAENALATTEYPDPVHRYEYVDSKSILAGKTNPLLNI